MLPGFDGKPLGAFNVLRKYPIVKDYRGYLDLYIFGFLGFITVIGTAFYFISKKIMLRPLFKISSALKEHNSFNLESYNAKQDEFGDLSRLITKFFMQKRKLEIEVEQRKKTEGDLYKALDDKYSEQTERIKAEEFLAQQQAALNINNTSADVPVVDLLKQIILKGAKTIQCERVGIWLFDKKKSFISADFVYNLSTGVFVPGEKIYETEFPVYFEHLKKDTLIIADDAFTHPATSCFKEAYLLPNNITSMLDVPVISGDDVIGVVCYEHTGPKRKWGVSELVFARSVSDIIALNLEREERKKAEEQLKKAKVRFEETQELAQIGSWEVNLKTMEVIWSTEMYRIFEIENAGPEELANTFNNKIHPDDRGKFEAAIKKLLEDGETYSVECRVISNNGEIKHIRAIGETMKSRTRQKTYGIRGTVQDITRQKLAAMAKSEFLSVMSHEIRTPINGVIGIANLLKEEQLNERQKEYVDTLNFSAQHLSTVVSDILDFSKIESGHMTFERVSFNLEKNCRYVYDLFAQKAAEKNLSFNFSFYPPGTESYSMYGDYVRLNQVLSNLLSNAIKFTEKGSVDFSYTIKDECNDKSTVSFSIKDSGIGITEGQEKNIFESFTQADETITRQYGGTGLGLTICKKLIELQNGKIFVKSIPGAGSEFIVELTFDKHVYKENDIAKITTAEKNQVKDLTGMKILVAEDNKVNAMVLTRFLTKWNITSKVAKDGAEALDYLKNETFDIVLMDIQMPNVDGIEATKLIRESIDTSYKDVTVVAFTADASVDTHRELLKNGFDHCMTKPFNPDTLFSFLKKNYKAA
jgi:signal transduction histidine kinase/ActR/RegA family two-component response regulator/GAF domain-containing protein